MKKIKFLSLVLWMISTLAITTSCNNDDDNNIDPNQRQFGIFKVLEDDETIEMNGVIGSSTLTDFNNLSSIYPNIKTINIKECEGSMDDEINLQVSLKVHQKGIVTHLMDNGLIASGGVDFFLAGVTRTAGSNTMIGVHSWSDGTNQATDFPVGHQVHQQYIDYYKSIGFTQADAESFYYFTINAAPASSIHYMTEAEIEQYNILKP
ncbi:hypothetical protein [Aquimarina sp. 2201CG5-10]|uniref:hypothetical protein n=1 Tax=Aquimarina callyspongiae TaxID=3098150 RepID=UPI002AB5C59E|nr:hypothetical protein [Aquimarina sp. 2201CG5-10]MDY8135903.1 hypothetical protein [Aquimarina sp. 2201CG5-10]